MTMQIEVVGNDVVFTRSFRAPRELVFEAWTDPEKVRKWWGCANTRSVESTIELRVGGAYRHVMQIEGAGEHVMNGVFTEVEIPSRLAYEIKHEPIEGWPTPPDMTTTVDFTERDGITEIRLVIAGLASSELENIIKTGWKAAMEKLCNMLDAA